MGKVKRLFQKLTPPVIWDLLVSKAKEEEEIQGLLWEGPYSSWTDAAREVTGYDQSGILEKCKESLLKVKNGEAVYERDSVIFDEIQYSWPLLAALQKAALDNDGKLAVLDFGGSLGSSYFQNKAFLSSVKDLSWSIVEQPHFVACGKESFQSEDLRFYQTIEQCLEEHQVNVLLLSSVLAYLEDPFEFFEKVLSYNFKYIIIDRTTFTEESESKLMIQTVPEAIYSATYPCWFLSEDKFKSLFSDRYSIIGAFESQCDGPSQVFNGIRVGWRGYFLEAKT